MRLNMGCSEVSSFILVNTMRGTIRLESSTSSSSSIFCFWLTPSALLDRNCRYVAASRDRTEPADDRVSLSSADASVPMVAREWSELSSKRPVRFFLSLVRGEASGRRLSLSLRMCFARSSLTLSSFLVDSIRTTAFTFELSISPPTNECFSLAIRNSKTGNGDGLLTALASFLNLSMGLEFFKSSLV